MAMAAVAKQIIVSHVKSQNGLQHRRQEQQMKMSHCSLKGELRSQEGDGDRETEREKKQQHLNSPHCKSLIQSKHTESKWERERKRDKKWKCKWIWKWKRRKRKWTHCRLRLQSALVVDTFCCKFYMLVLVRLQLIRPERRSESPRSGTYFHYLTHLFKHLKRRVWPPLGDT